MSFKPIKVKINIYETEESLIVLSPILEKVYRTSKKDKNGDPIIRYHNQNLLNVIDKKMFVEGPQNDPNMS